jgi:hypothetical protein
MTILCVSVLDASCRIEKTFLDAYFCAFVKGANCILNIIL